MGVSDELTDPLDIYISLIFGGKLQVSVIPVGKLADSVQHTVHCQKLALQKLWVLSFFPLMEIPENRVTHAINQPNSFDPLFVHEFHSLG